VGAKILICEDEKNIVTFLKAELDRVGYDTDVAYDGQEAIRLFTAKGYDLVLIDLMLPLKSGLEVLQALRKTGNTPAIILTARKDTYDKVQLLQSGADDYITKPFDTLELLARIERNIVRNRSGNNMRIRNLNIDFDRFTCRIDEKPLPLTKTEFEILFFLCQNADKVLPRETVIQRLYGESAFDSNVIDVNIKNIRRKISDISDDVYIETVRGKGYVVRP
jgi:two-component system response regulator ArlR